MKFSIEVLYFGIINIVSGLIFSYDKNAAKLNHRRIPEKALHLFEIFGGVFANIILIYTVRHKNRKFSYWIWTWLVLIMWILIFYFQKKYM